MAYIINRFSGQYLVVLEDGTLDTSTSIGLVGRNYTGYGEVQNENFLHLLENFANDVPPARPLSGQTWYNTATNSLSVYNDLGWAPVGSAIISPTEPTGFNGSLWYNTGTDQLSVYQNNIWNVIGPEAVAGFAPTQLKARSVLDASGVNRAILELLVDGATIAICSNNDFILNAANPIAGFSEITTGINTNPSKRLIGNLTGNADTASKLTPGKTINGVFFDGQNNIEIKSSTTNLLTRGTYLTGGNFDGSAATTWSVDASTANTVGKIVVRDSAGDFAAGTITADLIGNVTGNVSASTGTSSFNIIQANQIIGATLSGNANTANVLATSREINGVSFNGSQNITIPVDGIDITGSTLANNVVTSSLTSLGTLNSLDVSSTGHITIGGPSLTTANMSITVDGVTPTITGNTGSIKINIVDSTQPGGKTNFEFINSTVSLVSGGVAAPAFIPDSANNTNLGISTRKWNAVHANLYYGTAADLAENYVADADYPPGTVLEFGGEFEVTIAANATNKLAGVVTTNPAYLMNSECVGEFVAGIALQGRVPCKVQGKISKGDMLISAGNGVAQAAGNLLAIGTIIGKALENFDGASGVIEVAVGRI
jgi:hypothetical protein